jgi:hypothetical protein
MMEDSPGKSSAKGSSPSSSPYQQVKLKAKDIMPKDNFPMNDYKGEESLNMNIKSVPKQLKSGSTVQMLVLNFISLCLIKMFGGKVKSE